MSKPPLFPQASVSGVINDPNSQQRVIPESRRADGSTRKERKVKPGFTPAEDVTRFRSSRALDAERRKLPPGSVPGFIKPSPQLEARRSGAASSAFNSTAAALSKSAKKNAKRKENRAAAGSKGEEEEDVPDAWDDEEPAPKSTDTNKTEETKTDVALVPVPNEAKAQQDPAKRRLNLGKKIKAAESLLDKREKGEKLLPEQDVKVDSLEAMRKEMESLEL